MSIALCDHPDIELILERLVEMGYGISPASLRLDDLTEPIVSLLRAERRAVDHDRARDRIRSAAPRDQQDRHERPRSWTAPDLIFGSGIENLKLYYMIGLPSETDEDLVAIRDLTLHIRERMLGATPARAAPSGASSPP